jgi:hypothetical protein
MLAATLSGSIIQAKDDEANPSAKFPKFPAHVYINYCTRFSNALDQAH